MLRYGCPNLALSDCSSAGLLLCTHMKERIAQSSSQYTQRPRRGPNSRCPPTPKEFCACHVTSGSTISSLATSTQKQTSFIYGKVSQVFPPTWHFTLILRQITTCPGLPARFLADSAPHYSAPQHVQALQVSAHNNLQSIITISTSKKLVKK